MALLFGSAVGTFALLSASLFSCLNLRKNEADGHVTEKLQNSFILIELLKNCSLYVASIENESSFD